MSESKFSSAKKQHPACHIIYPSCFGNGAIIYKTYPFKIIKVLLPHSNKTRLDESIQKNRGGKIGFHKDAVNIRKSIIDYFNGTPIEPPWGLIDITKFTALQKSVLLAVSRIRYGELKSYKDIAESIGRPKACRFVGTTLAKNPFPILIPCHRVIRSDFSTGKFSGGKDLRKKLIAREAALLNGQIASTYHHQKTTPFSTNIFTT